MASDRTTKTIVREKSPNVQRTTTTTTTSTTTTTAAARIKSEPSSSSDEMKEFAETAMNELLGWYGYDGGAGCDGDADPEHRIRTRSGGDSSGPECSDSGGGSASSGGRVPNNGSEGSAGWWCGWCSRPMPEGGGTSQATGSFCSELCFSQSRRASFKKNRTCDWCRHVQHSVAHVDVRDGVRHLQFCSDKCLNQYKMHIFCRETQAHLELLNPHPAVVPIPNASAESPLITPDLWLRDCREMTPPSTVPAPPPPPPVSVADSTTRRRRLSSATRRTRTAVIAPPLLPTPSETVPEVAQDLRVRPSRSPTPPPPPPPLTHWPPPPPPVTVLVPYPVVVPVPVPLPLPIPIPISDAVLKRIADADVTSAVKKEFTHDTDAKDTSVMHDNKPVTRILRKRKRPADNTTASANIASSRSSRNSDSQNRRTAPT